MAILLELSDKDVGEETLRVDKWEPRLAARAIVLDGQKIALMHVSNRRYYKIPGGGVDEGESIEKGLVREIMEETGSTVRIGRMLGIIVEHRSKMSQIQTSHCFLAQVKEKGRPDFTDKEIEDGFSLAWVSLDEAIRLVRQSEPTTYDGKFIVIRDLRFLEEAKRITESAEKR